MLKILMAICISVSAAQAFGQSLHLSPPGTRVVGNFRLGNVIVPLPEGQWVLVGRGEARGSSGTGPIPLAEVYIAESIDRRISRLVYARAPNGNPGVNGWTRDTGLCDSTDFFHVKATPFYDSPRKANCFIASHWIEPSPSQVATFILGRKEFYDYLKREGFSWPEIRVGSSHVLNNRKDFLTAQYIFNSEVLGIDVGPAVDWKSAEWHKDRIEGHPDKRLFMQMVRDFGESIYPYLEKGLNAEIPVGEITPVRIPGWPVPR